MTMKTLVFTVLLAVGFWAIQRTWIWLSEARESVADAEEVPSG